ncbi:Eco57I restriction-modification methylase domain-containing protein [Candidatus Poribacteria bacterium]
MEGPEDAIDRLGIPSPTARDFVRSLWEIFRSSRQQIGSIDGAYRTWEGLYGCATNLNAEAVNGVKRTARNVDISLRNKTQVKHFLFALETYLAILLKLLVARVAVQQRLVPFTSTLSLLRPRLSERFSELEVVVPQLLGVFEHDSFSWFYDAARVDRDTESRLDALLIRAAEAVDDLNLTGLKQDFLRVFYQRFFDRSTRRALGEFYTSTKMMDKTLDAAGYDGSLDKQIADISCGSGAFVVGAIRRAIAKNSDLTPHEILQGITGKIIGIDIHPLAVAMARVNYILAISELLSPQTLQLLPQIRIPIFWADSLARPTPKHETDDLAALDVTIIAQCDYIVGNPPWVRIHNIEKGFRDRLFRDYQFYRDSGWELGCKLAGIGRGFGRQADLAMAFAERGLELLKQGGTLAFVITSKIQQALYANALRSHLVLQTQIRKLIDYSLNAQSLFEDTTSYPLIIALDKTKPSTEHRLDVTVYSKNGDKIDYSTSQRELSLLKGDIESPWIMAPPNVTKVLREMQNRSIVLLGMKKNIRPRIGVLTGANRIFIVSRIEATDSPGEVLAVTENGETIRIEKSLLRPLIRGKNLSEWSYNTDQYIIWTHDDETGNVHKELPPRAKEYFESHSEVLRSRDGYRDRMPIWTIFRVNPEKLKGKVAWQELAKTMGASCVPAVHTDTVLGTVKLIPLHTAYLISADTDQKAYILAGILNTLTVRSYFTSFAPKARGTYFRHFAWTVSLLPLPEALDKILEKHYKTGLNEHQSLLEDLAQISQKLHTGTDEREKRQLEAELNKIVATIYNLDENDMNALESYYYFVHGARQLGQELGG